MPLVYAGPPLTDEMIETAAAYGKTQRHGRNVRSSQPIGKFEQSDARLIERVTADSESVLSAAYALDGDRQTLWHTQWRDAAPAHPHWIVLEFKKLLTLVGLHYLPRQDRTNGWIGEYVMKPALMENNGRRRFGPL
jgi:hypothetical protein